MLSIEAKKKKKKETKDLDSKQNAQKTAVFQLFFTQSPHVKPHIITGNEAKQCSKKYSNKKINSLTNTTFEIPEQPQEQLFPK